ncbi:ribose-5-phosphate isomerase RpiA [Paenibacillus aurantius]|uniref:Ribose-5-phosphate isomerase A n=1 Tax=Paenibacillus aurantius TaxID=2918900 RepID=A0AA96RI51_9BACL|nr:ribose-5-phosphate isomerase RpiA [Paenibacillus aurantius]WNQ11819.1 ribose-5-phosphate isomerase RpiA [Paenibacillus aurantius]
MEAKQAAGTEAARYVESGMKLGLGTGSTVYWTIRELGRRVREEGLRVEAVPTSLETEKLARQEGIPLIAPREVAGRLDLAIDGADEVDPALRLIKGGGGALLREKLIAANAERFIVTADSSKCVEKLGRFPLPVEVVPFAWEWTQRRLELLGGTSRLRLTKDSGEEPYRTDNGNYVLDCAFGEISDPAAMNRSLLEIPGVVENGLFIGLAERAVIGYTDGSTKTLRAEKL